MFDCGESEDAHDIVSTEVFRGRTSTRISGLFEE